MNTRPSTKNPTARKEKKRLVGTDAKQPFEINKLLSVVCNFRKKKSFEKCWNEVKIGSGSTFFEMLFEWGVLLYFKTNQGVRPGAKNIFFR